MPVAVEVVWPKVLVVTTPEGGGCCCSVLVVVVTAVLVFLETVETVLVLVTGTGAGTGATPVDVVVEVRVTALVVDTPPVRAGWFGGVSNPDVTLLVDVKVFVLVAPATVCPVVPVVAVFVF